MEVLTTPQRSEGEALESLVIRPYTAADNQLLIDAFNTLDATSAGREAIISRFHGFTTLPKFLVYLANSKIGYRALIMDQEQLLGWGDYTVDAHNPQSAELAEIVMPGKQRRGVGEALFRHLIDTCRREEPKVTHIDAVTNIVNVPAIKFFSKQAERLNGFRNDTSRDPRNITFTFPLN